MAVTRDRPTLVPKVGHASAWLAVLCWAAVVTAMHLGGLEYDIYTQIWWWDIATHAMSGAGVAAAFYLLYPVALRTPAGLLVVVPIFVLGVGAGFEVYEYFFKDFWHGWSTTYYLQDTVVDLVMDVLGAYAFGLAIHVRPHRERSADAS